MCCFYLHSFHIQYSFCAKNCLLLLVYNNLPFPYQEDLNIPNHSVFDCFVFFFQSKNISYTFNFFVVYFSFFFFFVFFKLFYSFYLFFKSKRVFRNLKRISFKFFSWEFYCLNCSILIKMRKRIKNILKKYLKKIYAF